MKDCFALKGNECTALNYKVCEGCTFYKTKAQFKQELKQTKNRIKQLDKEQQIYIHDKYYDGK